MGNPCSGKVHVLMPELNEAYDWYILEINPEPWAIGPIGYSRRGGKMSAYVGRNQQLDTYKEAVKEALEDMETTKLEGKIALRFFFWRTRADYQNYQSRTVRKHEADTTNLQKATEDALQGILFDNDKDVVDVHSSLVDQSPTSPGRIVIGVGRAQDVMFADYPFDKIKVMRKERKPIKRAELEGQEELFDNAWPPRS